MTADPIEAILGFLGLDVDVANLSGGRLFAGELPPTETASMPRAAVVVKPAGGAGTLGAAYQPYGDRRVDVICYGDTPKGSWDLHLAVASALKHLRREVHADVLLHWARPSMQGATGRDPDTDWPLTLASFQVLAGEPPR